MTSRCDRRRAGGFTLIEILAVLAVLGLALGLVVTRGPARPRSVDLRVAAAELADTLRLARAQAIAANRAAQVVIDTEARVMEAPGGRLRQIPPGIGIGLRGLAGPVDATRMAMRFAPDGSSSGGGVELSSGGRRLRVSAVWLTGRVSIADVP